LGSEPERPLGKIGHISTDGGEMHDDQIHGTQTGRVENHGSETSSIQPVGIETRGNETGSIEGIGVGTGGNETGGGEIGGYQSIYSGAESEYVTTVPVPERYDPDRPPWGIPAGIGTWLFSVVAIIMIPAFVLIGYLIFERVKNPDLSLSSNALRSLLMGPSAVLVNVLALFVAHIATLGVVWAVVTRFGRYPFFSTLGLRWTASYGVTRFGLAVALIAAMTGFNAAIRLVLPHFVALSPFIYLVTAGAFWALVTGLGRRPFFSTLNSYLSSSPRLSKLCFVIGVVFAMFVIELALGRVLPESRETDFEKLLKTSQQVRVAVAVLAVLTAPLVEEAVYRGVLFSALISRAGVKWTIAIVTFLFAIVHFPQYWGAWSGLAGITVLSLTLTVIRARMKSILPCIAVHFLFNAIGAVSIILQKS
jgi:membrane protease YdiL (CAAX protease family)